MIDPRVDPAEQRRRWRLILGSDMLPEDGEPGDAGASEGGDGGGSPLSAADRRRDALLSELYGGDEAGLGDAAPVVADWLREARHYFPVTAIKTVQGDALSRLQTLRLARHDELLAVIEPDVQLVGKLLSLSHLLRAAPRESLRAVVRAVVDDLLPRLTQKMRAARVGVPDGSIRKRRPRYREIDWQRTIRRNLRHYQPGYRAIIPEELIGHGQRQRALHDVVLCVDQSGSMRTSFVYAGVFAAVLASLPTLDTRLIAFSTSVVDLSDQLQDPVELLLGAQLRGGTDIARALVYSRQLIMHPDRTTLVLISDLFDGKGSDGVLAQVAALRQSGVLVIVLLALSDDGTARYDENLASALADMGVTCFACTPDQFPELMALALNRGDLAGWLDQQRALLW